MTMAPQSPGGGVAAAAPSLVMGNLLCVGSMVTWAMSFPAADVLLQTWDPLALIAARLMMAVAMLVPLWAILDGPRAVLTARWGRGAIVGGLGFGLGTWMLLLAQSLTDAVTVAIIASSMPIVATVFEIVLDGRRPSRNFLIGMTVCVTGGIVAVSGSGGGGANFIPGVLAALLSVVMFCYGSRAAVQDFPDLSAIGRTTITLAGGLMFTGTLFAGLHQFGWAAAPRAPVDAIQLGYLAIYALAGMALSQLLWISSVQKLGIAIATCHINAAPFYVMVVLLALGGAWNTMQALGAAIVITGVIFAQRRTVNAALPTG